MPRTDAVCRNGGWRGQLPCAIAMGLQLLAPGVAFAHAHLRRSEPAAGTSVVAPRALRLWFSEEPELPLTVLRLADSAGVSVVLGAPTHDAGDVLSVRFVIGGTLRPGPYTVTWKTAALDGHPSNGTFSFRVSAATGAAAPERGPPNDVSRAPKADAPDAAAAAPSTLTPPYVAARTLSFVALLGLVGAVAFRYTVLPRLPSGLGDARGRMLDALASGAAVAAACYLVTAVVRLSLQNRMMTGDAVLDAAHMRSMAMESHWGAIWRLQFGAGAAALAGALIARRWGMAGWLIVTLAGAVLALASALAGHAAASESLRPLAEIDDALHVVGAAGWLGSLLWLVAAALPALQRGGARARRVASLVNAFSPTALAFAGLVGITGLVSAWLRLESVPALWTSSYGRALLVKLALLVGVAATGFYNWRYVQPALGTDVATARLRRSAGVELAVGVLVLVATAVLVAMPTPVPPGP